MPDDNKDANSDRRNPSDQTDQRSQDTRRHQNNALHHKFPNGPLSSAADEKHALQSQARAQQDSVDMQQSEGQQPEIPKVGSRDAPGG